MIVRITQPDNATGDLAQQLSVPAVFETQDVGATCLLTVVQYRLTPALRYE